MNPSHPSSLPAPNHSPGHKFTPEKTAALLRKRISFQPELAMVLGSGFQSLAAEITSPILVPYEKLPGFPALSVTGHNPLLIAGLLAESPLLLLCGRSHFYEGHSLAEITFPIRVLAALGIKSVLLTNAAGGIHRKFRPGDFMALTDHINLMGANPLRGASTDPTRFVDLTQTYDPGLIRHLQAAARTANAICHSGVYLAVSGPSYETPAEIRAFARLGADAVGMSTIPEAIVARQCGLAVAGLSCITNLAAGRQKKTLSHSEVLAMAKQTQHKAIPMLKDFARRVCAGNF
jgi:purine-nucleoside phosphorylase